VSDLRPPATTSHEYHWLIRSGAHIPARWHNDLWTTANGAILEPVEAWNAGFCYFGPCVPIDPGDDTMVEVVARAICRANGRDPDAPRWINSRGETWGTCWHENIDAARAVLVALTATKREEQ
jgi:hypothetical protein